MTENGDAETESKPAVEPSKIVEFWSAIFLGLSYLSIMRAILALRFVKRTYTFVEYYVFSNTLLSALVLFISCQLIGEEVSWASWVAFGYACARIFEIVVYQMNVVLFDEYRAKKKAHKQGKDVSSAYAVRGYRRTVILLLHNYFEIICWFGVIYTFFYRSGDLVMGPGLPDPTFYSIFRDSLLLMFSFNADWQNPSTDRGLVIFSLHASIGVFMTVLAFARFLALLPPPASKDEFER